MENQEREVVAYQTEEGLRPYEKWFNGLRDRRGQIAIDNRLTRLQRGLFGDSKDLGDGVKELRIDFGPGYRVYFALDGPTVVLLLCGNAKGSKNSQNKDITEAKAYWNDYKRSL
jgi:putative addiction module killer protein